MEIELIILFVTFFVSGLAAWAAYRKHYLTKVAAIVAVLVAVLFFKVAGWSWALTVAAAFLVTSWLSSIRSKKTGKAPHPPRDVWQLLANGLLIILLTLCYGIFSPGNPFLLAALMGSLAAVSGDTWASSVARLSDRQPRSLRTGRLVAVGTPGAVSVLGLLLSGIAGVFVVICFWGLTIYVSYWPGGHERLHHLLIAGVLGGVLGALVDSALGAYCQSMYQRQDGSITDAPLDASGRPNTYLHGSRWLTNNRVNFFNSVGGAVAAAGYWYCFAS